MRRFLTLAVLVMLASAFITTANATTSAMVSSGGSTATNTTATGWLDKIEIVGGTDITGTWTTVIGTYTAAGGLIDTYATASVTTTNTFVIRPRLVGTTTAGTALTSTTNITGGVLSTVLDRPLLGGNLLMKCTGGTTGTVTATLFFIPVAK